MVRKIACDGHAATHAPQKRQRPRSSDTAQPGARAIASVGGRYRFRIGEAPATFRVQLANVGDKFGWANGPSGIYLYNYPRRLTLTLTTDFN